MDARGKAAVEIVEVGPRDGYQGIGPFIPTGVKIRLLEGLAAAGLRRIEIGSFVSATALPQMRDTPEVLAACRRLPGVDAQVLVPSERRGRDAVQAGARRLVFVLSVSEAHNRNNVRRHPLESAQEYERLLAALPPGVGMRLDLATAFDCPFTGRVPEEATLALLDRLVPLRPDAEVCLCDTTGRVAPDHVAGLFARAMARFPGVAAWAFHGHDTYNTAALFDDPQHPYTVGLLGSIPRLAEERDRLVAIEGSVPPPFALPRGCRFHPRCVFAAPRCAEVDPPLLPMGPGHGAACIRAPVERIAA